MAEAAKPELCIYGVGENDIWLLMTRRLLTLTTEDRKPGGAGSCVPAAAGQRRLLASLDEVPRQAFTLTIPVLMRVSQLYGMVPGKTKIAAIDKAINGPVTTACPASILRTHPHAVLYLDEVSAQKNQT